MSKRIGQHILFWTIYFIICLYNELYLSQSFSLHPSLTLFLQNVMALCLLFAVKMTVVYFILYKLIPNWLEEKNTIRQFSFGLLSVFVGALLLRLTTQNIIWPYVYREEHEPLRISALLARYFYSLLDLLQIVGVAVSVKLYKLRMASVKNEKSLILERGRAEILHLKSQTNPHFLFNTLNSIYSLARSKSEQTPDTIMRLSKLLRYTLYDSEKKTISIQEELKIINDYIELQQLRFGNRIKMDSEIKVDSDSSQITPLLLLPIVENAYKHCNDDDSVIVFNLNLVKNNLILKTSNPAGKDLVDSGGTGLPNLKRQLELLYKEFSLNYGVKDKQFILELMINLNSYAGNELFDTGG